MGHTPMGYKIVGGVAVIDEAAATKIRSLYENYLSGLGLKEAASKAGIETYHGTAKRIMSNRRYLGDDYYPAIIDRVTFQKVQAELQKRASKLGRLNKTPSKKVIKIHTSFTIVGVKTCFDDPIMQAEYIYSLIESEVS